MKILVIDYDKCGLPFTLKCDEAGHDTKIWMPPSPIGEGMVEKVKDWKKEIGKADLVFVTDNSKGIKELEPYHKDHPIFGPNLKGSELELDRECGQNLFDLCGIDVLPYEVFTSYDKAIEYVKREGKPFVSKPWGGNPDKDLSYVPKTAEDLVSRLQKWKTLGTKPDFMLQEMVTGQEMAVGGWFGPGGFIPWYNENWEEKRLMVGGLGPNTGEMGTVMRYVKSSKLADDVLLPVADYLHDIGYVGYIDVNCIVDDKGTPWPLEFTCRPGWPHFNLCMALHKGDPAKWMLDLLNGKSSLNVSTDICVGVVMALGDYPWDNMEPEQVEGWPIRGLSTITMDHVALSSAMMSRAPVKVGGKVVDKEVVCTAGSYVLIATGLGETVCAAREKVYETCDEINWPPHRIYRTDIGCRLEEDIPLLQKQGYAKGLDYGTS
jgi:phosphoribosylamine--glycine ligase